MSLYNTRCKKIAGPKKARLAGSRSLWLRFVCLLACFAQNSSARSYDRKYCSPKERLDWLVLVISNAAPNSIATTQTFLLTVKAKKLPFLAWCPAIDRVSSCATQRQPPPASLLLAFVSKLEKRSIVRIDSESLQANH